MSDKIESPFTSEQVTSINGFQEFGGWHPFTCGGKKDDGSDCRCLLVATEKFLYCPDPSCDYRQNWVFDFMANNDWKIQQKLIDEMRHLRDD